MVSSAMVSADFIEGLGLDADGLGCNACCCSAAIPVDSFLGLGISAGFEDALLDGADEL